MGVAIRWAMSLWTHDQLIEWALHDEQQTTYLAIANGSTATWWASCTCICLVQAPYSVKWCAQFLSSCTVFAGRAMWKVTQWYCAESASSGGIKHVGRCQIPVFICMWQTSRASIYACSALARDSSSNCSVLSESVMYGHWLCCAFIVLCADLTCILVLMLFWGRDLILSIAWCCRENAMCCVQTLKYYICLLYTSPSPRD